MKDQRFIRDSTQLVFEFTKRFGNGDLMAVLVAIDEVSKSKVMHDETLVILRKAF